jgi:hypothetical protein
MASELKFLIDNLDRGQPLNPEDFGINITEDDAIGARIVSFDNELIFGGDVFTYLYTKLATSGYCELVRVSVQYLCSSGTWQRLVEGYIIATECIFSLDKCEVKTKIYDETFSTKINNNKSIPFSLRLTTSKNGATIVPPTIRRLYVFDPGTGSYYTSWSFGYGIYDVFKHLVTCMSDGLIDFDSNLFAYSNPNFDTTVYTQGNVLRTKSDIEMFATFEQVYLVLKQKLNLGMGFERQANGRPLLRIEPVSYFQQSTPSVNLYDQPDIEMNFDTSRLYASVNFGSSPYLFPNECNGGEGFCLFPQPKFLGFRDEAFGFIGQCNTSNILNLKTSDVIFDHNVIEDILRYNSQDHELSPVIIQSNYDSGFSPNSFSARFYNLPGLTIPFYNLNFSNESVSGNWLNGYPNSLQGFFNAFDPTLTPFDVDILPSPIQQWEIVNTTATSFSEYNGVFPSFNNEIIDNGNNFSGQSYIVPFSGVYTFNVSFLCTKRTSVAGNYTVIAIINRLDGSSTIQQEVLGTPVTGGGLLQPTATATFYCNQGDIITTDVTGASTVGNLFISIEVPPGIPGFTISRFYGSGSNFQSPDLQPVDINDVQAYLYKFNRPLTMAEINAITSETSKPILLGRKDDALAVSPTYIRNIQIESVMRKNAQFELRSNKLLP